jgi:hypothetical protein
MVLSLLLREHHHFDIKDVHLYIVHRHSEMVFTNKNVKVLKFVQSILSSIESYKYKKVPDGS